jgi:hypothetical protein
MGVAGCSILELQHDWEIATTVHCHPFNWKSRRDIGIALS